MNKEDITAYEDADKARTLRPNPQLPPTSCIQLHVRLLIPSLLVCTLALCAVAWAYDSVLIQNIPHVPQKPDFCGEACAEMYLRALGHSWTQDQIFNESGLDPSLGRGCHTPELRSVLLRIGFDVGPTWYTVPADKPEQLEDQFKSLHADLLNHIPSIVCIHSSDKPTAAEHMRLVLGYDSKTDEVIYHEPAQKDGAYLRIKKKQFLQLWPLKYDPNHWTVIRMSLKPLRIIAPPPTTGFTNADYAQHVMQLNRRLPAGFSIVVQRPFVVVGDDSTQAVRAHAQRTVQWAVDRLKQEYFAKDPDDILDIYLFRDKTSYDRYTKELFNDTPSTPYGYYSQAHNALIMNIATGGGTLVHEIVHPFMHANFPNCPAWFNEGLGSLYEQCGDRDGHILGYTNWRLPGLQQAIRNKRVPSFGEFLQQADAEFYGQASGIHYAQARYLCYYLQEKGLLTKFYQQFLANQKHDPSGYNTLKKVLAQEDMDAFKRNWEAFVLALSFP